MSNADPWLIIMSSTTEANARLMVRAMREAGIELPTVIVRRSEARTENISAEPKPWNAPALAEMAEEREKVGRIMSEKARKREPRAVRSRL